MPASDDFRALAGAPMDWLDQLPAETRVLINEHSQRIVQALIDGGMTDPRRVAHVLRVLTEPKGYRNRGRG